MIAFIDKYRDRFSVEFVEFICATLNRQHQGGFITLRGYRNAKYGAPSAKSIRGRDLVAKVRQIHAENYGVYGLRKMWHALTCCGLQIGREQTARLMRLGGVSGKGKGAFPDHDTSSLERRYQARFGPATLNWVHWWNKTRHASILES